MSLKTETIDTLSNVGSKLTATGLGTIGLGWLTAELALGITGALATLLGLLVNFHYKRKASKRRDMELALASKLTTQAMEQRAEMHAARMAMLKAGLAPPPSDFAPLAPLGGPWSEDKQDDDDGR